MRCGKCLKPRILFDGTGHRMENYPWTENTAAIGRGCECKDPWFPDRTETPEQIAEYKEKKEALMDRLAAETAASYMAQMIDLYKKNQRPRLEWMTDAQWAEIEKERTE